MNTRLRPYISYVLLIMMTFVISVNGVLAQEEVEAAAETGTSAGLMIGILGIGILVILGLGFAMNAQAKDDNSKED